VRGGNPTSFSSSAARELVEHMQILRHASRAVNGGGTNGEQTLDVSHASLPRRPSSLQDQPSTPVHDNNKRTQLISDTTRPLHPSPFPLIVLLF